MKLQRDFPSLHKVLLHTLSQSTGGKYKRREIQNPKNAKNANANKLASIDI